MKAFVTGATGLLGNNLVRQLLQQGTEVKALVRSAEKAKQLLGDTSAEFVIGDMEDVASFSAELADCDVVFHCAAYFREYYQPGDHWQKMKAINVDGTLALLAAAEAQGVDKVIYVSSTGAIGRYPDGRPSDEQAPFNTLGNDNLYFRSKVLAEQEIGRFLQDSPLPVVLICPGWMYGPYDAAPTSAGRLVQDFLEQKLPGVLNGGSMMVDARDVAQAMINAVAHGRSGERYLVAGRFTTMAKLMALLETATGVTAPRMTIPTPVALAFAWVSQSVARLRNTETLMTVSGVRTLVDVFEFDSSKAQRELGIEFRPFVETLRDTADWYRKPSAVAQPAAV